MIDSRPPLVRTTFILLKKKKKAKALQYGLPLSFSLLPASLYMLLTILCLPRICVLPGADHISARAGSEWRLGSLYGLSFCFGSSSDRQVLQAAKATELMITCRSIVLGMPWNCARFTALPLLSFSCYNYREVVQHPADQGGCQTHLSTR